MSFLDQIPAAPAPPGEHSNLTNPVSQGPTVVAIAAVFTSLATVMTIIRFHVRVVVTRSIGWDDWFCGLALICSWIHSALIFNSIHLGYGNHMWDIRASILIQESNVSWLQCTSAVYPVAIALVKISILLLYHRIFKINQTLRSIIIGSIICISAVDTAYTVTSIVSTVKCVSLLALEDVPICSLQYQLVLSQSVFNVVSDFWILFLPMKSLLGLKLDRQRKLGLVAVFGTGAITCLLSIARCIYIGKTLELSDSFWTAALSSELTLVELNVAIMVACAPTLPKFYKTSKEFSTNVYHSLINRSYKTSLLTTRGKATSLNSYPSSSRTNIAPPPGRLEEDTFDLAQMEPSRYKTDKDHSRANKQPILRTDSYEISYEERRRVR